MKLDPKLYNDSPMSPQDIYMNLAKAVATFLIAAGSFVLGTERFFGYLDDHYILVTVVALGSAIWSGTFFVRIGSGIFDGRFHK